MLNNSILTKPTLQYPAYTERSGSVSGSLSGFDILSMYPNNQINTLGQVMCQYIRFPFAPKWTYLSLTNGEPSFDPTQPDYQDFELPNDDEVNLVNKILQYAGMSIREIAATQFGQAEEQESVAEEKQIMAYITQYQYYENGGLAPENKNWGSYQYVSLEDIVNNFMLMYADANLCGCLLTYADLS